MSRRVLTLSMAFVLVLVALTLPAQAQNDRVPVEYATAVSHALTPPIRDIHMPPKPIPGFLTEIPIRVVPGEDDGTPGVAPENIQLDEFPVAGASVTPQPIQNFKANINSSGVLPPDTDGAIGKTQYLQWVNLIFSIYDKANGNLITGPTNGNAFFTGLGGPCQSNNNGDPVTTYDQKHDRWVVSQFAINQGMQCIAVSTSSDATGTYNAYAFSIGGANDYPKQGLWLNDEHDVMSLTYRTFGGPGGSISLDFQVVDYEVMLAGGPNPGSAIVRGGNLPANMKPPGFQEGTLPADVDGNAYAPNDKAMFGRFESGSNSNEFFLWTLDGNFPGGTAEFNFLPEVPITAINRPGFNGMKIPQPGTGVELDSHASFTMQRLPWRNRGTHQELLAVTSIDAGGDRAGKHFVELRAAGGGWSEFQAGSYAPNPPDERWMGSIASDASGNIAIGYSVSSASTFPSIRYTSRTPNDPLGMLPGGEVEAVAGGGSQTHSAQRWGDYSDMSIDPEDDCTFWFTTEYLENTGSAPWVTRVTSFKFAGCGGPPPTGPEISLTSGSCGGTVTIQGTGFTPNSEVGMVGAANLGGFVKGGTLCPGAVFEIGEPFDLPPTFPKTDGSGNFTEDMDTTSGFCWVEALDLLGSCQTSNALDTE